MGEVEVEWRTGVYQISVPVRSAELVAKTIVDEFSSRFGLLWNFIEITSKIP